MQLTLPPIKGSAYPIVPSLIRHCNFSGERRTLIVSEDGLVVASLVIDHCFLVGQIELLLLEMAARPTFGRAIKRKRRSVHWALTYQYVYHDYRFQSGKPVYLEQNLPVSADGTSACHAPEAALCELTYYHRWENISAALGNNEVSTKDSTTSIRDEYYNVCELDDAGRT